MPDGMLPWILVGVLALVVGWLVLGRKPRPAGTPAATARPAPAPAPAAPLPEPVPEEQEAEHEDAFFYELAFGVGYYRSSRHLNAAMKAAADALLPGGHSRSLIEHAREIWELRFGGEILPDRLCKERILPVARNWADERKDTLLTGGWLMLLMDDPEAGKGYVDPNAHERLRLEMTAIVESLGAELYGGEHETRMASVRARAETLARDIFPAIGL